jgi:hypothetical protein
MNRFKCTLFLITLCLSSQAFAFMELAGTYYYSKQTYGTDNSSFSASRNYTGTLAWYMFEYTAIEGYYAVTEDTNFDDSDIVVDSTLSILSSKSKVLTTAYGFGIRQSLANRKARIVPAISVGIAKQKEDGEIVYKINDNGAITTTDPVSDSVTESELSYVTISLKIKVTQTFGIKGSMTGTYPDFKISGEPDNIKYTAGISWVF